jgi:hypothetical protein
LGRLIEARHPFGEPQRVDEDKYQAMRTALLSVIPEDECGIPERTLTQAVHRYIGTRMFHPAELSYWVTTVTLDLMARGLVEEVSGEGPHRVRRRFVDRAA